MFQNGFFKIHSKKVVFLCYIFRTLPFTLTKNEKNEWRTTDNDIYPTEERFSKVGIPFSS